MREVQREAMTGRNRVERAFSSVFDGNQDDEEEPMRTFAGCERALADLEQAWVFRWT